MPALNTVKLLKAAGYEQMVLTEQKLIVAFDDGSFKDVGEVSDAEVGACTGAVLVKKDMFMPMVTLIVKDNLVSIYEANKKRVARQSEEGFNGIKASLDIDATFGCAEDYSTKPLRA